MAVQADHIFVDNCLQPYCSVLGKGISILGVFQVRYRATNMLCPFGVTTENLCRKSPRSQNRLGT